MHTEDFEAIGSELKDLVESFAPNAKIIDELKFDGELVGFKTVKAADLPAQPKALILDTLPAWQWFVRSETHNADSCIKQAKAEINKMRFLAPIKKLYWRTCTSDEMDDFGGAKVYKIFLRFTLGF